MFGRKQAFQACSDDFLLYGAKLAVNTSGKAFCKFLFEFYFFNFLIVLCVHMYVCFCAYYTIM